MSDLRQEVATIRALRYLDLVEPSAAVAWARGQTTGGEAAKGLVDLAGLSDMRGDDVDAHVSGEQAARELTCGAGAPIEAARRIWRIARLLAPSVEPRLRVFIGLASEWEDDPDNRASYEEEIRSEALCLEGGLE